MEQSMLRSIRYLKGVGEKRAALFEKLGVFSVLDMLSYFPRDYEDRSVIKYIRDTQPGEFVCVRATVASPVISRRVRAGLEVAHIKAVDATGTINLTFFNQKYLRDSLKEGGTYVFYGKIDGDLIKRDMVNPVFDVADNTGSRVGRIIPVYPLTAGLSQLIISKCVNAALEEYSKDLADPLSSELREKYKLAHSRFAYENIHNPADYNALSAAKKRMVFEELFMFSIGMILLKGRRNDIFGCRFADVDVESMCKKLPFKLTGAQRRAIDEALCDMTGEKTMNRLVQGDVGSGKTVVAVICAYAAKKNGYQTAVMAPTEILAEQHLQSFRDFFKGEKINIELLSGSMTAAKKRDVKKRLAEGEIDIVIGTHALLTEDVSFAKLGLVVTDEQHRFGVRQRSTLLSKGERPNLLVMSATPIPRTLALILYGDLELSVIDELPPGRMPVDTFAIDSTIRARAYGFVRKHLSEGRQAYIVCPLVEENRELDLKAAQELCEELRGNALSGYSVELLHGKMKAKEKEEIMRRFSAGEINALVSTTVIEVGVNVPNAVVMVVENAERFGLSQLHQLRGRVGRGKHKSYCILFSDNKSELVRQRLKVMCSTNDGFVISEEDLKLRGPGDFFGTRQHGAPELKIADLAGDSRLLKIAQEEARAILENDPGLKNPENAELSKRVKALFKKEEYGDIFN